MWTCPKCKEIIENQFDTCWNCAGRRDGTEPAKSTPHVSPVSPPSASGSAAFVKGGCGCLVLFAGLAFLALLFGGQVHADLGGLVMLFVVGGAIGLIGFAIYNKGRKDGNMSEHSRKDDHDI